MSAMLRRSFACLGVVALLLLALIGQPAVAAMDPRFVHDEVPTQPTAEYICHPATIPQEDCDAAVLVYDFALTHNWAAPRGYKGGKIYLNDPPSLPIGGNYLEYDIYPAPPPNTGGRDSKRLVIEKDTQIAFYTADHFSTFVRFSYS